MEIQANLIDVVGRKIFYGKLTVAHGRISEIINEGPEQKDKPYLLPGLVDAHVHIESSMLIPSQFARLAVIHGTVATVSDPHEIANVNGLEGVAYMIDNGKKVPFHFNFGAPSCVPATGFETAGAILNSKDVAEMLQWSEIKYLAEMMNYPGVIFKDPEVLKKIEAAKALGKPIDGHAPGLRGQDAKTYFDAGISTDHECFTLDEALEKAQLGVKILIREGSAAKNFDTLIPLFDSYPEQIMFCSDDKHPNDLIRGHINLLIKRALAYKKDFWSVISAATLNPVKHYGLANGLLQLNDNADMILVDNLLDFNILKTYINGTLVAEEGQSFIPQIREIEINHFNIMPIHLDELHFEMKAGVKRCIEVIDGELITKERNFEHSGGEFTSDVERDILKIVVVNRYQKTKIAQALVAGTGIKKGAIASSVAHDSHNIIAIGTNDEDLCKAINAIISEKGGISWSCEEQTEILSLPIAGLMSQQDGYAIGLQYEAMDKKVKEVMSCSLSAPFMTLSFLALLVIPKLKLSDLGLFDGEKFEFVSE